MSCPLDILDIMGGATLSSTGGGALTVGGPEVRGGDWGVGGGAEVGALVGAAEVVATVDLVDERTEELRAEDGVDEEGVVVEAESGAGPKAGLMVIDGVLCSMGIVGLS